MLNKKITIDYVEYGQLGEMSAEDRELAEAAVEAAQTAYARYSNFKVGAAVRLEDGTVIKGSNQENIAYPSGLCAERTAMFYANASHPDKAMSAIAVAGVKDGKLCASPASPCGACRQVMAEYQTKGGRDMEVILVGADAIWKFSRVDDILPFIFDSL